MRTCENCGAPQPWKAKMCSNCGHALEKRQRADGNAMAAAIFIGFGLSVSYILAIVFLAVANSGPHEVLARKIGTMLVNLLLLAAIGWMYLRKGAGSEFRVALLVTVVVLLGIFTACDGGANFGIGPNA